MLIDKQKENKLWVLKRMKEQNMLLIQNQFSSGMCPRDAGRFPLIKGIMKKKKSIIAVDTTVKAEIG